MAIVYLRCFGQSVIQFELIWILLLFAFYFIIIFWFFNKEGFREKKLEGNTRSIQKSALTLNSFSAFEVITPAFWYSPTLLSKKLVLPWSEIISIQSKGFLLFQILGTPKASRSRSATHSMYCVINWIKRWIPLSWFRSNLKADSRRWILILWRLPHEWSIGWLRV